VSLVILSSASGDLGGGGGADDKTPPAASARGCHSGKCSATQLSIPITFDGQCTFVHKTVFC